LPATDRILSKACFSQGRAWYSRYFRKPSIVETNGLPPA
jgi:hypothetical protein